MPYATDTVLYERHALEREAMTAQLGDLSLGRKRENLYLAWREARPLPDLRQGKMKIM
jgi:hypothetical protein